MGGMELFGEIELDNDEDGSAAGDDDDDACLAVSEDPVSIWTTCLNEEVSAWTKVVGYGLVVSDLEICVLGVTGGVLGIWITDPLLLLLLLLLVGLFPLSWILEVISIEEWNASILFCVGLIERREEKAKLLLVVWSEKQG